MRLRGVVRGVGRGPERVGGDHLELARGAVIGLRRVLRARRGGELGRLREGTRGGTKRGRRGRIRSRTDDETDDYSFGNILYGYSKRRHRSVLGTSARHGQRISSVLAPPRRLRSGWMGGDAPRRHQKPPCLCLLSLRGRRVVLRRECECEGWQRRSIPVRSQTCQLLVYFIDCRRVNGASKTTLHIMMLYLRITHCLVSYKTTTVRT